MCLCASAAFASSPVPKKKNERQAATCRIHSNSSSLRVSCSAFHCFSVRLCPSLRTVSHLRRMREDAWTLKRLFRLHVGDRRVGCRFVFGFRFLLERGWCARLFPFLRWLVRLFAFVVSGAGSFLFRFHFPSRFVPFRAVSVSLLFIYFRFRFDSKWGCLFSVGPFFAVRCSRCRLRCGFLFFRFHY